MTGLLTQLTCLQRLARHCAWFLDDPDGLPALADPLSHLSHLRSLQIADSNSYRALCHAAAGLSLLTYLTLENVRWHVDDLLSVAWVLTSLTCICDLHLSGGEFETSESLNIRVGLSLEEFEQVAAGIAALTRLRSLTSRPRGVRGGLRCSARRRACAVAAAGGAAPAQHRPAGG